jgi:hypothetical protein
VGWVQGYRADETLSGLRPSERYQADLVELTWITPAVMVATAARAHATLRAGHPFVLRGPAEPDPAGYAARMRLGRTLSALGASHDLPTVREFDQRANLLEVTALHGPAEVRRLAALVFDKVAAVHQGLAVALHQGLAELGANVHEHSGTIGFMAAQTMPRRRELRLAVADAGAGLQATLARRGAVDDRSAILKALRGTSQFDGPERGTGLPTTVALVTALGGSVYLTSGDASVRAFARARRHGAAVVPYQGTVVEARIPLDRHSALSAP